MEIVETQGLGYDTNENSDKGGREGGRGNSSRNEFIEKELSNRQGESCYWLVDYGHNNNNNSSSTADAIMCAEP